MKKGGFTSYYLARIHRKQTEDKTVKLNGLFYNLTWDEWRQLCKTMYKKKGK